MFKGIITPIVTPFNRDQEQSLNYPAAQKLTDYLIKAGVSGIFALGTNGEFHVLSRQEKIAFTSKIVQFVNHRVPVFAGAGACSTHEAIKLATEMAQIGVDALSVICPYFIRPSAKELIGYYQEIAASVDLPIILYNIPQNTGYNLPVSVVKELAKSKNIVGIKDSSGDLELLKQYQSIACAADFQVLIGSDSKISDAYHYGVRAAIAGTSNLIPQTLVALDHALNEQRQEKAQELQESISVLRAALKLGTVPAVLKRALELAQIAEVGPARKPVAETTPQVDDQIIAMLKFYHLY